MLICSGTGAMAIYPLLFHRLRPDAIILATGAAFSLLVCQLANVSEKDTDSLNHARQVASSNQIKSEAISILEVPASGGILFPLLNDPDLKVDFTMCNSPFFSSSEEMQRGIELKIDQPHAVSPLLASTRRGLADVRLLVRLITS
jgi:23S rRNA A1618 N6-methylase RlmF